MCQDVAAPVIQKIFRIIYRYELPLLTCVKRYENGVVILKTEHILIS